MELFPLNFPPIGSQSVCFAPFFTFRPIARRSEIEIGMAKNMHSIRKAERERGGETRQNVVVRVLWQGKSDGELEDGGVG